MADLTEPNVLLYFCRLVSAIVYSPSVRDDTEVINFENVGENVLVLDLDNGLTIRLDIDIHPTN